MNEEGRRKMKLRMSAHSNVRGLAVCVDRNGSFLGNRNITVHYVRSLYTTENIVMYMILHLCLQVLLKYYTMHL